MQHYFITATGTGIGKTLVTASLCHQWRERGARVEAFKPVISGFLPDDSASDTALLLESLGREKSAEEMARISPWQFMAPLAPPMAAAQEGREIVFEDVLAFCRAQAESAADIVLFEGAGGVMSPLSVRHTMLDLMQRLELPVILVTGGYLGAISHTLTAWEALKSRDIPLAGVVISEAREAPIPLKETAEALRAFMGASLPIAFIPPLDKTPHYRHTPDLLHPLRLI